MTKGKASIPPYFYALLGATKYSGAVFIILGWFVASAFRIVKSMIIKSVIPFLHICGVSQR